MSFATYNINAQLDAKAVTMAATTVDTPEPGYVTLFTDASERFAVKRDNGFVAALNMPVTVDTVYTFPTGGAALSLVDTTIASLPSLTSAAALNTVGTIAAGTWQANVISPTYGGTGFNNGSNTIQLAGSLTTAGANPLTLTTTGPTNVTLPTTGTLVNTAVTALNSLASAPVLATVGTITTGVWNGTDIAVADGGTGVSTLAAGGLLYGNGTSPVGVSAIGTSGQLLVSGGSGAPSWSGTITYASNKLTGLAAPTANSDAVNKQYVDETVAGLSWKTAARASTTAALTVTYSNGASGVGATLTNAGAQAAFALDGVTLALNDRVLIKNQASSLQNGIYYVSDVGSGASNWVLTRAVDADNSPVNELNSAAIFVTEGTVGANRSWTQTTASVVVGTSPIVWSQFAGTNTYTASGGISLVGNDFQITSPLITTYGGTGFSSYAAGDLLYGTAGGSLSKLTAGTATQVLHGGATPSWSAVSLTADVSGVLPVANGGTNSSTALASNRIMVSSGGAIVEAAALTNGQLLIGSTGAAPVAASIAGTANRVTVTNGAGTITLSGPQDIHTGASPTFVSENLTATSNQLVLGTTNTVTVNAAAPAASRTVTIPDVGANASFVMTEGAQTINGNKTISGTTNLSSLTASLPLVLDASKNIVAQQVSLTTQVTNVLPIANGGTALSAVPTAGQLLIGTGSAYALSTLTAGAGVTIVNGAGSITISSSAATAPQSLTFVNSQFTVTNTTEASIAFLPHDDARFGAYANRTVRVWVLPGDTARTLTIHVRNNAGVSLGNSGTIAAGGAAALVSFNISDPGLDTRLQFGVVRSAGAGTSPVVFGATLEYY